MKAIDTKALLNSFEKETLISLILEEGFLYRYRKENLKKHLDYLEWDRKTRVLQEEMEKACAEMKSLDTSTTEGQLQWWKVEEKFDKAFKASQKLDKKHHM